MFKPRSKAEVLNINLAVCAAVHLIMDDGKFVFAALHLALFISQQVSIKMEPKYSHKKWILREGFKVEKKIC